MKVLINYADEENIFVKGKLVVNKDNNTIMLVVHNQIYNEFEVIYSDSNKYPKGEIYTKLDTKSFTEFRGTLTITQ